MALPNFDIMVKMDHEELEELLEKEVESLIASSAPDKRHRYRAMFNGCKLRNQACASKSPMERAIIAHEYMIESLDKLHHILTEVSSLELAKLKQES